MSENDIHLVWQILDRELIDSEFASCGKIDDIELEGEPGGTLRITTLLVGPGAWAARLPALIQWLAEKIAGKRVVRIPWEQVKGIGSHIQLKSSARDLGLNEPEMKMAPAIRKIPGGL